MCSNTIKSNNTNKTIRFSPYSSLRNGELFAQQHRGKVKYCDNKKVWLVYKNGRWIQDDIYIVILAKETIAQMRVYAETLTGKEQEMAIKHWEKSSSPASITSMLKAAESEPGMSVDSKDLDNNSWLFNCQNGTINLQDGTLRDHNPDDLLTHMSSVSFDPEAKCPRFLAFLAATMDDDQELVGFLKRIAGYMLTGSTKEQVFFILWGNGSNGKSTFVETLRKIFCSYSKQMPAETLFQGSKNDLEATARLAGARMVTACEAESMKRLKAAFVKSLTGSDTIASRFLYHGFFEFSPQLKLMLVANQKPNIRSLDYGIWRRIVLVPFESQFEGDAVDKDLAAKLEEELPGILTWALQGCMEWQQSGLGVPEKVKQAVADYRQESDDVGAFIEDRCILGDEGRVVKGELYSAYVEWAKHNSDLTSLPKNSFGSILKMKNFKELKSGPNRYWNGISIASSL